MAAPRKALFWTYDPQVPSFRHRLQPLADELGGRGWAVAVEPLPRGRYFRRLVERRAALREADLVVLGKLKLGLGEPGLLRRFARRLVFDFDDSVHLRKPRRLGEAPDRSRLRRLRFARTCRGTDLVTAGNAFLAAAAAPHAPRVEVVPTSVDVTPYPTAPPPDRHPRTVTWIGRPENLLYLQPLRPVFGRLAHRHPDLRLRIICSEFPDWPELEVERVPWSAAGEARALATSAVGIMPLSDDDWTRGKCAFKLLQYMAAGLPCVGSPVGANREAVVDGETGYLAGGGDEWEASLDRLLGDAGLRLRLGEAGRRRVTRHYERRAVIGRAADLLEEIGG